MRRTPSLDEFLRQQDIVFRYHWRVREREREDYIVAEETCQRTGTSDRTFCSEGDPLIQEGHVQIALQDEGRAKTQIGLITYADVFEEPLLRLCMKHE